MSFVYLVFRYHITASGCELAEKLVRADAMLDDGDCLVKPKHVKSDRKPPDNIQQHVPDVPLASRLDFADCQLPQLPVAVEVAVAGDMTTETAAVSDEDRDWQRELDFILPEQNQSRQPR